MKFRLAFLLCCLGCLHAALADRDLSDIIEKVKEIIKRETNEESHVAEKSLKRSKLKKGNAFDWVQKFLVSFKMSRELSPSQRLIEKLTEAFMKTHNLTASETYIQLQNIRPLHEISKLADSDETDRKGYKDKHTVDTCPYQRVNCRRHRRSGFRTYDGSCNNLKNPLNGKAFTPLARFLDPDYADGISKPRGGLRSENLPSPRLVSSKFSRNKDEVESTLSTYMVMTWGQVLDHDIDLTAISKMQLNNSDETVSVQCGDSGCKREHDACFPIPVPEKDPAFGGRECLTFVRSQGVPNSKCSVGPRQQVNQISAFIDASMVYGSTKEESNALRDLSDEKRGRLLTTKHPIKPSLKPLLPQIDTAQCTGTTDKIKCFKAGDPRANEAPHLTTSHTILMREHNRIEAELHKLNPRWSGGRLFQETRKIIGAIVQRVSYNEYLPAIFSESAMKEHGLKLMENGFFRGYDPSVDASIANVFATAAYRFGHSMIPGAVERPDVNYKSSNKSNMHLSETLFRPAALYDMKRDGLDGFVRGLVHQKATKSDRFFSSQVSQSLFTDKVPSGLGTDLYSINIQRGRDHGLPGYGAWREFCNLDPVDNFSDLKKVFRKPEDATIMKGLYSKVEEIDLFPAGLAEKPLGKGLLGETFSCILGKQFNRLRYGDRFWHENKGKTGFKKAQLQAIRTVSMARLFCENSDNVPYIQPDVMRIPSKTNKMVKCKDLPALDLSPWKEKK